MTLFRPIKVLIAFLFVLVGFGLISENEAKGGGKSKSRSSRSSTCPKKVGEMVRGSDDKIEPWNDPVEGTRRRGRRDDGPDSTSLGRYGDGDGGSSSEYHPSFQDGLIPGTDFKSDDYL